MISKPIMAKNWRPCEWIREPIFLDEAEVRRVAEGE
jgi:hypothetical protein